MTSFPPINDSFKTARDERAYEKAQMEIQLLGGNIDPDAVSLTLVNTDNVREQRLETQQKRKRSDQDLLLALQQIQQHFEFIEAQMIDKYGEDFAEQFAAELLDEETFKEIMSIEDQEERRNAIAKAILEGIENGTIDPADVYSNPDFKEWLEAKNNLSEQIQAMERVALSANELVAEDSTDLSQDNSQEAVFDQLFNNSSP